MSDIRLFSINFLEHINTIFNSKMSWMWCMTQALKPYDSA
jgi:hypothetical protein